MGLDDVIGDVWPSHARCGWSRQCEKSDDKGNELVTETREKREKEDCFGGGEREITIHDCKCECRDTAERGGRVEGKGKGKMSG